MLLRQKELLVPGWKENVINLIQFPRCGCIPTISPYALKLETWLRFNKLNYTNVSNELVKGSKKGQIPFIEHNGQQIADSNFIIDHLKKTMELSIDRNLSTRERADQLAYHSLIEDSLLRTMVYFRGQDLKWLATEDGLIRHLSGVKKFLFKNFFLAQLQKNAIHLNVYNNYFKKATMIQGVGRHSAQEVNLLAKKDLTALSTFLGNKRYFFGDKPTMVPLFFPTILKRLLKLDATAFGTLAQLLYTPLNGSEVKMFIEQSTPNLVQFTERVKSEYWSDWQVLTTNLIMNANDPVVGSKHHA
ncbi:hypothetical protein M3Y96_00072700 [Aphelenchoides besseyi]|nr:hypothetical protein M3Y96_00072700 [Aphelenchoides besseyi]